MKLRSKRHAGHAAVAILALACQERQTPAGASAGGSPGAAPGASGSGAASANSAASASAPEAPAPGASASASPSASAGLPALPGFVVGRFSGKASVYGAVVDDRQTYRQHEVEIVVEADGKFTTRLARGTQGQPADHRCEASGLLRPEGALYRMTIEASTCQRAKAGSTVDFSLERVGNCLVVWNRVKGSPPFEVEQISMRKAGC